MLTILDIITGKILDTIMEPTLVTAIVIPIIKHTPAILEGKKIYYGTNKEFGKYYKRSGLLWEQPNIIYTNLQNEPR